MARPPNADATATKQRILDCALSMFSEGGESVSIRKVAKGSGVTLATVHHYFGSKADLWDACVGSMYDELDALQAELLGLFPRLAMSSRREALRTVVVTTFRFARAHQPAMRMILRAVVESGQVPDDRRERVQKPFLERASELLSVPFGRPPESFRLPLQSAVFLIARYAISSDAELEMLAGEVDPLANVEAHLVEVATAILSLPNQEPSA